jgi:hypothetical protein
LLDPKTGTASDAIFANFSSNAMHLVKTKTETPTIDYSIFRDVEGLKNDIHSCNRIGVEDMHIKPQPSILGKFGFG